MKLLTDALRAALIANNARREADHIPVVKLFLPGTGATWIFTEMEPDGLLFGLCDVGHGSPELGYASLEELEEIKARGLGVERDLYFSTDKPLSVWTEAARRARMIVTPE